MSQTRVIYSVGPNRDPKKYFRPASATTSSVSVTTRWPVIKTCNHLPPHGSLRRLRRLVSSRYVQRRLMRLKLLCTNAIRRSFVDTLHIDEKQARILQQQQRRHRPKTPDCDRDGPASRRSCAGYRGIDDTQSRRQPAGRRGPVADAAEAALRRCSHRGRRTRSRASRRPCCTATPIRLT